MTQLDIYTAGKSPFDAIRHKDAAGEYWLARELMPLADYTRWDAFAAAISKARTSLALVQGEEVASSNFLHMESNGYGQGRRAADVRLTRFGAYLVAMAADDTKPAIAHARVYFAVQTRRAETGRVDYSALDINDPHAVLILAQAAQRSAAAAIEAQQRADRAEQKVGELAPKAEQADHYRKADGIVAVATFANDLQAWAMEVHGVRILHEQVRDFMGELKVIIRGETIRNNNPTAQAIKNGWMRTKHTRYEVDGDPREAVTGRLTPKGVAYVWDRAVRRIEENGSLLPVTDVERRSSDG